MEHKLNSILADGETLLWSGAPEQFKTMSPAYKGKMIRKILLVAVSIIVLSGWYISAAIANGVAVRPIAIVICALPFLYSTYNDFRDAKKLQSGTLYAMTDRRMITIIDKSVSFIPYEKISCWKMEADGDGVVSLICGDDAMKGKATSRRAAAVCGAHTNIDTDLCESYVMYGITHDAGEISKIAAKHIAA